MSIQTGTLRSAVEYASSAHSDAVAAVAKAKEALLAASTVEQDAAIVLSTLRLLFEQHEQV